MYQVNDSVMYGTHGVRGDGGRQIIYVSSGS